MRHDQGRYAGRRLCCDNRLRRHRTGKASRYTASRLPVELVYSAAAADRGAALREEARIKRLRRDAKLALIAAHEH